jgi:acyl carrier protein
MNRTNVLAALKEGISDVFPEASDMDISGETHLHEIPGWDSMAAVNLQVYLEDALGVAIPGELLSGQARIEDILEHILGG